MTQLGEMVAIGIIQDPDEPPCPFTHESPPEGDPGKNELIGSGSTLAKAMKASTSTDLLGSAKPDAVENPRYIAKHPLYSPGSLRSANAATRENWPVSIRLSDDDIRKLPVRCAAHHLIPAQESLKDSRLVPFMVHRDTPEDVKGGSVKGVLWRDVGYNVNGSENGVFLPGSYAVGGGRGGLRVWSTADEPDHEQEDLPENADNCEAAFLTGNPDAIDEHTPKWQYVKQAMRLTPGQFHDRHADYSREVQLKLDGIAKTLAKQYKDRERSVECPCEECRKSRDKWKDAGYPPPAALVARLNTVSSRFALYLNGSAWAMNLYTSKWCKAYMQGRQAGKAWAKT